MLLVDAEGPVTAADPWQHLQQREGWQRPARATDDQCHLMVQVMETWFLADQSKLRSFYGQRFRENALPANPDVEQIPRLDVFSGLTNATRNTQKGSYDKGSHSFEILAMLDPSRVEQSALYARRFLETLRERTGSH
jgi:hypothetical protein